MAVLPGGLGKPHREGAIQAGPCEVSGLCLDKGRTGSGTLRELAGVAYLTHGPAKPPVKTRNPTSQRTEKEPKLPSCPPFSRVLFSRTADRVRTGLCCCERPKLC